MSQLELTGKFFLDIPEIDTQHQTLLDMINEVHALILSKGSDEDVRKVIQDFLGYTKTHFSEEESFMMSHGYSGLRAHQKKHEAFINGIYKILEEFQTSKFLRFKFFNFAMDLLMNHIEVDDYHFAQYLKSELVSK